MKFESNKYPDFYKIKNKYFRNKSTNRIISYEVVGLIDDNRTSHYILKQINKNDGYDANSVEITAKNCGYKIISFDKDDSKTYVFTDCSDFLNKYKEI